MPREAVIGATRGSYVYRLRVPAPLKAEWDEHCAKQGKNPAAIMRALMRYMIQDNMPPDVQQWIATQTEGEPDAGPKTRLEIRFTPTELQGVAAQAEAEGCSSQRWVINCVRASLTHKPQFGMTSAKALWESSYQLRAIGKNLNQIAKRLNEGTTASITTKQVETLSAHIYRHTNAVASELEASLSRWGIQTQKAEAK